MSWTKVPLGDVVTLHYGKALPKAERDPTGNVPLYGANGIKEFSVQSLATGPSLIVGRKGSAGEVTRAEGPFWPLDVTYYTEHDDDRVDFDFLEYALAVMNLPSLAKGVKPGINRNEVYALSLPLPPLEEQKRIVAVLDQAFAALDRAHALAEANLADAEELFEATIYAVFSDRKLWPVEALNDRVLFVDYRGKTPPKRDQGVRLITAKNVRMGYIKDDPREFMLESAYDDWMVRGFPEKGDVLFTTEAPLANVAELNTDERVVIGQRLITMKTKRDQILPRFLKWSLLSTQMQTDIRAKGTGATVTGIKSSLLKKIPFFVPSELAKQQTIADKCERAFQSKNELMGKIGNSLSDLDDLRQSLLQKAFAGELI